MDWPPVAKRYGDLYVPAATSARCGRQRHAAARTALAVSQVEVDLELSVGGAVQLHHPERVQTRARAISSRRAASRCSTS